MAIGFKSSGHVPHEPGERRNEVQASVPKVMAAPSDGPRAPDCPAAGFLRKKMRTVLRVECWIVYHQSLEWTAIHLQLCRVRVFLQRRPGTEVTWLPIKRTLKSQGVPTIALPTQTEAILFYFNLFYFICTGPSPANKTPLEWDISSATSLVCIISGCKKQGL